jgi:hypothetical protein
MSPEQKNHLKRLVRETSQRMIGKYVKGQKEHGGDLWKKKGIIDMAIEEAIDQVVYLLTLKEQLEHPELIDPTLVDK